MRTITNACGTFWVEDDGTLQYFECAPDNYGKYKPEYADVDDYDPERHLIRLDIPEGITVLSTDFDFNNCLRPALHPVGLEVTLSLEDLSYQEFWDMNHYEAKAF